MRCKSYRASPIYACSALRFETETGTSKGSRHTNETCFDRIRRNELIAGFDTLMPERDCKQKRR